MICNYDLYRKNKVFKLTYDCNIVVYACWNSNLALHISKTLLIIYFFLQRHVHSDIQTHLFSSQLISLEF